MWFYLMSLSCFSNLNISSSRNYVIGQIYVIHYLISTPICQEDKYPLSVRIVYLI